MRVPKEGLARLSEKNLAAVQAEIAREKASSLGRAGARLEKALARYASFEGGPGPERDDLRAAASEALWYYVVQREAIGARDVETVLREFRVPREVYLRMGKRPRDREEGG